MDIKNINKHLKNMYAVNADKIILHRELIGRVFIIKKSSKKYILKIYRETYKDNVLQISKVLSYLQENGYHYPEIYKTIQNENISYLNYQNEYCPCILSEYIDGEIPDEKSEASKISFQLSLLHMIMKKYSGKMINRTKFEYIDEFIILMKEKGLGLSKVSDLNDYGFELWSRISLLPKYFCHGDFHTGNIIRNFNNQYIFFDYDDMSGDWPIMDIAYLSDITSFNNYSDKMFENVQKQFYKVNLGYKKNILINQNEYEAIFDFIALRRYQIFSRIFRCTGLDSISKEDCNKQYNWLMKWRNCCQKRL